MSIDATQAGAVRNTNRSEASMRRQGLIHTIIVYVLLIGLSALFILPFLWMV